MAEPSRPAAVPVLPDPREPLARGWWGAVHERFAAQAERVPGRIAVEEACRSWSYRRLAREAAGIAVALRQLGIGEEDRVAVYAERGGGLVAALLGSLQAGAAFTILDPAHPPRRLCRCLRLAGARAQVVPPGGPPLPALLERALGRAGTPVLRRWEPRDALPAPAGISEDRLAGRLAYVAFTSGSTGEPLAVLGEHGSLSHFFAWYAERFGLGEADRFAMLSGLGHDPLLRDVFTPLWLGATLCVPEAARGEMDERLARWLARERVSVLHLTPSLGQVLDASVRQQPPPGREGLLPSLRLACFAGETLTLGDAAALAALAPRARILNAYGTTETPQVMAFDELASTPQALAAGPAAEALPVGRGIPGAQLLVLDEVGRRAAVGEEGEVAVRSPFLARGYAGVGGRAEAAEAFSHLHGVRLFRTGDRGRRLADGRVVLTGRRGRRIQLRGWRIAPEEVEAACRGHPWVRRAVVSLRPGEAGQEVLVAYAVPREPCADPGTLGRSLRRFLEERLPAPMVPVVAVVSRLPLTANGKVDEAALAWPLPGKALAEERPAEGAAAAGEESTEARVADAFAAVLGVERVGPDTDFFALGGESLLGLKLLARLREAAGPALPLRTLFDAPTPRRLARRLEGGGRPPSEAGPVPSPDSRPGLTPAERGLWFLARLGPENPAYNLATAYRLRGALDPQRLAGSLAGPVRRHEALRTVFPAVAGRPKRRVNPAPRGAFPLPRVNLEGLEPRGSAAEAHRLSAAEAVRPFRLERGPLLRAVLLRLGPEDHLLLLDVHHLVVDGASLGILYRELLEEYRAPGRAAATPDHDGALDGAPGPGSDAEHLAYWRRQLAGAAPPALPFDRPRPPRPGWRAVWKPVRLPAAETAALAGLGRRVGGSLYTVLAAAFLAWLGRLSGSRDAVAGTPIAHRPRPELEDAVGFFVHTLPLRADLGAAPNLAALAARVREAVLDACAHAALPLDRLVRELAPGRGEGDNPLFGALLAYQAEPRLPAWLDLGGAGEGPVSVDPVSVDPVAARFDLELEIAPRDGGLEGTLVGRAELFDASTVARLARGFEILLRDAASRAAGTRPDGPLASLEILGAAEAHALAVEAQGPVVRWPRAGAAELVVRAAARSPAALAVADGSGSLAYGDLLARARRVAMALRRRGVGPETPVALLLERGTALIAAVLGVLLAGGFCVPLDPAYPRRRIAFMLRRSRVRLLVAAPGTAPRAPGVAVASAGELEAEGAACPDSVEALPSPEPRSLAYAVFTSGSTGRPKGVAMTHGALANLVRWQILRSSAPAPRTLQLASPSFDVFFQEVFSTLGAGGLLVLGSEAARRDAELLGRLLAAQRMERLFAPFVVLQQLAEAVTGEAVTGEVVDAVLPCLSEVVTAGEALQVTPAVEAFFSALPAARLENHYGPSESHVVTAHRLEGPPSAWPRRPPIGRAVANARVHLLDSELGLVPLGVAAEVYLGGACLARGYLHEPALTAERFLPDPHSVPQAGPGERLYRTGDRARRLPGGEIAFLGRLDDQVKIRGFRVEPGEVEAALAAHPAVLEAAVVAGPAAGGGRRLVAFFRPRGPAGPALAGALRSWLAARLPAPLVPTELVTVDSWPLTASGKLDRRALTAPAPSSRRPAAAAPRDAIEAEMARIWSAALEVESVGPEDDFFALGGHSLLAVRLMARVEEGFRLRLPLATLFEEPTVEALARAVRRHREARSAAGAAP